jgi:hypothetical protein
MSSGLRARKLPTIDDIRVFAEMKHTFDECSSKVRQIVSRPAEIFRDESVPEEDKMAALDLTVECLFPRLLRNFADFQKRAQH